MLKKMTYRKLAVTFCALLTLVCFYFFPNNEKTMNIKQNIIYEEENNYENIFLLDKYNYVSVVSTIFNETKPEEKLRKRVEYLIINGEYSDNIPNGFKPIIPIDTKINSIKIDNNKVSIDFSEEILSINEKDSIKMLETLIFTVTENSEINEVYLYIKGKPLDKLYNNVLKYPLTRDFGINKKYNFNKLSDLTKTTVYYVGNINDNNYYVPITYISNDTTEKIMVIINELKSSLVYQSNLSSYLNSNVELKKYEIIENTMYLDFNDKIFDIGNKKILEEVKYTISESVFENYGVKEVVFKVNGEDVYKTLEN